MNEIEEGDTVLITIPCWMARENDLGVDDDKGGNEPYDLKGKISGISEDAYQVKTKEETLWVAKSETLHIEEIQSDGDKYTGEPPKQDKETGEATEEEWGEYAHTKYDITTAIEIIKHSPFSMGMLLEVVEQLEAYRKGDDEEKIREFYQTMNSLKEREKNE